MAISTALQEQITRIKTAADVLKAKASAMNRHLSSIEYDSPLGFVETDTKGKYVFEQSGGQASFCYTALHAGTYRFTASVTEICSFTATDGAGNTVFMSVDGDGEFASVASIDKTFYIEDETDLTISVDDTEAIEPVVITMTFDKVTDISRIDGVSTVINSIPYYNGLSITEEMPDGYYDDSTPKYTETVLTPLVNRGMKIFPMMDLVSEIRIDDKYEHQFPEDIADWLNSSADVGGWVDTVIELTVTGHGTSGKEGSGYITVTDFELVPFPNGKLEFTVADNETRVFRYPFDVSYSTDFMFGSASSNEHYVDYSGEISLGIRLALPAADELTIDEALPLFASMPVYDTKAVSSLPNGYYKGCSLDLNGTDFGKRLIAKVNAMGLGREVVVERTNINEDVTDLADKEFSIANFDILEQGDYYLTFTTRQSSEDTILPTGDGKLVIEDEEGSYAVSIPIQFNEYGDYEAYFTFGGSSNCVMYFAETTDSASGYLGFDCGLYKVNVDVTDAETALSCLEDVAVYSSKSVSGSTINTGYYRNCTIDHSACEATITSLETDLASTQATLETTQTNLETTQTNLDAANTELSEVQTELSNI